MGQVPKYCIVGDGRMARHFAHYLQLEGVPFTQWSRRSGAQFDPGEATVVLLLIRDGAIESFARDHLRSLREKKVVHFSGSLITPLADAMHPMMTFGPELYDRDTYRAITFVTDIDGSSFGEIFPQLRNPSSAISPELRPLYHSYCVMAGNFPQLLWQRFTQQLESTFGVSREAALPYIQQVARNFCKNPGAALTGPIARGDLRTIESNLQSLIEADDPLASTYAAFTEAFAPEVPALVSALPPAGVTP